MFTGRNMDLVFIIYCILYDTESFVNFSWGLREHSFLFFCKLNCRIIIPLRLGKIKWWLTRYTSFSIPSALKCIVSCCECIFHNDPHAFLHFPLMRSRTCIFHPTDACLNPLFLLGFVSAFIIFCGIKIIMLFCILRARKII